MICFSDFYAKKKARRILPEWQRYNVDGEAESHCRGEAATPRINP